VSAVAPAWGWKRPGAGRLTYVDAAPEFQATTFQACGLFPFTAGSGSPTAGVPVGRHQTWGEVVCLDPLEWLDAGLVTNPGMFVLGQPGTGKTSLAQRLIRGMAGYGVRPLVLGDTKPDYSETVRRLGGQVIRVGRGLDRINPLDAGPLGDAAKRIGGAKGKQLRAEVRGRRLASLLALCSLVRPPAEPIRNGEEVLLGRALDLLTGPRTRRQPTVPNVLQVLRDGSEAMLSAAEVTDPAAYLEQTRGLRQTLSLLCTGTLAGVFDGDTTTPIDLDAPAVSVDISNVAAAGDTLVAAAMLSTWAYGFGVVDASLALAEAGLAPARNYLAVMDELWRALRGAPGLVEHADALTRLNRSRGMAHLMLTHSLADLDALPTPEDRAKAQGFVERCGITVLAGLSPRETGRVTQVVPMSAEERALVESWSAPESWQAGARHPGRGKYLIKTGRRVGIPVDLGFVGDEATLYDTDQRVRAGRGGR
jgi:hypothetical protein